MKVGIAGLTHLGVCMSIAAHHWGADVIGFDTDAERVGAIRRAEFDQAEPGVVDFLTKVGMRYSITDQPADLADCDVVLIAVDTTLTPAGQHHEDEVSALLMVVSGVVRTETPIVVASQVRPGFCRAHAHLHRQLYYFMETLIFGRGLERATFPERYIVGVPDVDDGLPAPLLQFLELAHCPVHVMSYESAELTKLSANVVLAATITAANSLAELAEALGADWRDIESALRADTRIGTSSYISAGLGIGGANIIRDLIGVEVMANRHGRDGSLARTLLHHSDHMRNWTLRSLTQLRQERSITRLGILGLAYKPGTTSMRGGAGLGVVAALDSAVDLLVYDPAVSLPVRSTGSRADLARSAEEVLSECDVVAITTPWPQFSAPVRDAITGRAELVIVDPYRLIKREWSRGSRVRVLQLGVSSER